MRTVKGIAVCLALLLAAQHDNCYSESVDF